jgi:hypothetical protein
MALGRSGPPARSRPPSCSHPGWAMARTRARASFPNDACSIAFMRQPADK